jgi:hypothetical protein
MAEIALSRAVRGTREILRDTLMGRGLRGRLADFKVPRVIRFETTLPREDSGKIIKRKLREPYWADTGRLDWRECLAVTGEALARQMDPFIFVFDDPANDVRAPAMPLQDRHGSIGVSF